MVCKGQAIKLQERTKCYRGWWWSQKLLKLTAIAPENEDEDVSFWDESDPRDPRGEFLQFHEPEPGRISTLFFWVLYQLNKPGSTPTFPDVSFFFSE